MQRHSISFVSFCLFFGVLIGAAGLLSFALITGLIEPESQSGEPENTFMSATERLETYRCRPAETKYIVMGGIEDNYSPDGEETAVVNPGHKRWENLTDYKYRDYDELGLDKRFTDDFIIPTGTYHGIIAIGLKEIASIKNDGLMLSITSESLLEQRLKRFLHLSNPAELKGAGWQQTDSYYWADLEKLAIKTFDETQYVPKVDFPHLLSGIRDQKPNEFFNVEISDDTLVDFIGFALCLEPEEKKGFVFSPTHYFSNKHVENLPAGHIYLTNAVIDGKICGTGGCLSCELERPVACIKDENLPVPDDYGEVRLMWSGGYIDFTPAVSGSSFATEDDVDRFCAKHFGDSWRHLNGKDGRWEGHIIGLGQTPKNHTEFWVGFKDGPHHNCWDIRPEYKAENDE